MEFEKIQNKGQAQLFSNRYLEMLTKTHPLIIWGMYTPVIAWMIYYSAGNLQYAPAKIAAIFFTAIFCWTFFEYMAHRYLFHWISTRKSIRKFTYTLHGNHHHYPRDKQRLFMPPVPSILISGTLFLVFRVLMGHIAFVFWPGFVLGYLVYASMHYAIHAWAPPFKWMKTLWRNHHLHHYKDDHKGFGVSTTLWDRVFRTGFDQHNPLKGKS